MVAYTLAKYAKNIDDVVYWIEDSPPLAVEALYQDSLHIIDWMNALLSKKKRKKKKQQCILSYHYLITQLNKIKEKLGM